MIKEDQKGPFDKKKDGGNYPMATNKDRAIPSSNNVRRGSFFNSARNENVFVMLFFSSFHDVEGKIREYAA